mgnify:CR=1 FL=1
MIEVLFDKHLLTHCFNKNLTALSLKKAALYPSLPNAKLFCKFTLTFTQALVDKLNFLL